MLHLQQDFLFAHFIYRSSHCCSQGWLHQWSTKNKIKTALKEAYHGSHTVFWNRATDSSYLWRGSKNIISWWLLTLLNDPSFYPLTGLWRSVKIHPSISIYQLIHIVIICPSTISTADLWIESKLFCDRLWDIESNTCEDTEQWFKLVIGTHIVAIKWITVPVF